MFFAGSYFAGSYYSTYTKICYGKPTILENEISGGFFQITIISCSAPHIDTSQQFAKFLVSRKHVPVYRKYYSKSKYSLQ
jgi:hypothetical protein